MGSVAASGGLYAALGATRILAMPGTLTGSIGVMMQVPNLKGLLDRVGIEATILKSGPYKDAGSIFRPLTEDEKKVLMATIRDIYQQFVETVAKARNLPLEKVKKFADGRVFTGRQAKEYGLVDELGNFERAIQVAADLAGIKGKPHLVYPRREKGLLKRLLGEDLRGQGVAFWFSPLYIAEFGR
jgi:protease-4